MLTGCSVFPSISRWLRVTIIDLTARVSVFRMYKAVWLHLAPFLIQWCRFSRMLPSLKTSNFMYSYKLSDHELQPARWEHCSPTSPHGGPWDEVHRSLQWGGNRQPSLKSRPTPSVSLVKPNVSMWGHWIVTPPHEESEILSSKACCRRVPGPGLRTAPWLIWGFSRL